MAVEYDYAYQCVGPTDGQIGLQRLRTWAMGRWRGIQDLGIYACRLVRGGGALSVHANGRAWDCRWPSRGALDVYLDICIANADKLNIQRIIDYSRRRIWTTGKGWQSSSVQSPGGLATHTERNWDGALDARAIDTILGPTIGDEEDEVAFLPVRRPAEKAGPSKVTGGRMPGYLTSGTKILGLHGAALAGDRAVDGTDAIAQAPKTEVRVLQTVSRAKLVDLFYWVDDQGREQLDKIGAVAADFGTFGPYQCT
jgi:hypothetical protein